MCVPIYKCIYFFLSELEATLELRSGVALIIQYKITVAGVAPMSAAAPCWEQQGRRAVLFRESRRF